MPQYMTPVRPGGLIQFMTDLFPFESPNHILNDGDVVQPPLRPVRLRPPTVYTGTGPMAGEPTLVASTYRTSVAILAALVLMFDRTVLLLYI